MSHVFEIPSARGSTKQTMREQPYNENNYHNMLSAGFESCSYIDPLGQSPQVVVIVFTRCVRPSVRPQQHFLPAREQHKPNNAATSF